jgi:tRNA-Thr(GGU) m(6)t(6)A37 methyltransferase TsaA
MTSRSDLRPGETAIALPAETQAGIFFIGRIRTPWPDRLACPRQGQPDGPECRIEVAAPWDAALEGIEAFARIEVLYWLHESRRDILRQSPKNDGATRGAFALRSPVRPNPIATQLVALVRREGNVLVVRGLDCIDGTPLVDLKPDSCAYTPLAPAKDGAGEVAAAPAPAPASAPAPAGIARGHGGFGCASCWPDDADAAWKARQGHDYEQYIVDDSHFIVRTMACSACGQRFLSVMTETIDWDDGDDPQHWITIPVTDAEAGAIVAAGERGLAASVDAIDRTRRSLVHDAPKGAPATTRWSSGIWIARHD